MLKRKGPHVDNFLSLTAPEVVIITTFGAASDRQIANMTFPFQWDQFSISLYISIVYGHIHFSKSICMIRWLTFIFDRCHCD